MHARKQKKKNAQIFENILNVNQTIFTSKYTQTRTDHVYTVNFVNEIAFILLQDEVGETKEITQKLRCTKNDCGNEEM